MNTKSYKELKWVLRGLSGLIIFFYLFMFIGETWFGEKTSEPLTTNSIIQLSFTGICLLGLGLGWKWELIGGIIALLGFVGLSIINPTVLQVPLLHLLPGTAILYIVQWYLTSKNKNR